MQMDSRIPFMGVVPDYVNALAMGQGAAMQRNEGARQNALAQLYQAQGPGIIAGEQGAVNALAAIDPGAALGVMDTRQGMDARSLGMDATRLGMDATRQDMRMQAEQWAASLDEREAAEAREGLQRAVQMLYTADTPEAWDAMAQQLGKPELMGQFAMREQRIAEVLPFAEAIARTDARRAPQQQPNPQSAIAKLEADFRAGLISPEQYQIGMQNMAPTGMDISVTPGGGISVRQGPGVTGQEQGFVPSDPSLMIQNIDAILTDPALPYATGADAWRTKIPGSEARRVGARMDQLEGQAFLQAFESLKGAGQITEIEGLKATQAIGRLDRYQSQADYEAALRDLRAILEAAAQRPPGWANTPEAQAAQGAQPVPAAPVGQSQFVPSAAPASPAGAPPVTVNANGPAFTGQVTADAIRTMTPMQYAEWAAVNAGTIGQLPDDVLQAIMERGE
jgi:hypothetical protein